MKTNALLFSLLITVLLTTTTANAQFRFGIRGELGVNKPSLTKDLFTVENMNAYKIGPTLEFMLPVVGFGVDGSILYSNEKMKVNQSDDNDVKDLLKEVSSHYIDVPVNLKYKIGIISPVQLYLAAGPYVQFKVGGDDFKLGEIVPQVQSQVEDKVFQAGLNFGIGVELLKRVQAGFNYRLKMTDNYSVNEPTWKDLLNDNKGFWSLTAAVYF